MIEINLLPEDRKAKPKPKPKNIFVAIEVKYLPYLVIFIFGLLVCVYLYLLGTNIVKGRRLAKLSAQWQKLEPQRKELEDFKKQYALSSEDAKMIEQSLKQRINYSAKLNKLSLLLPAGAWFDEISISPREFSLHGSIVSLQKNGMNMITEFIERLKKDAVFLAGFKNLELGPTQWRSVGGYDVVDFVLTGTIDAK